MTTISDTTRRRCPDERPQQIVDAALEVFGERGLAGARLDDIAQRAGVAKGTIYLYFANKEELFQEVVRRTIVARLDRTEREIAEASDADAAAQMLTFMHGWWEFACTDDFRTVYRLVVGELHRFPDLADFYIREVAGRSQLIVNGIIARGVEQGVFRRDVRPGTGRMISALLITQATWAAKTHALIVQQRGNSSNEELRDQVCDFVFHALRPEPQPGPERPTAADAARVQEP
jgi:AcrR family transcriptional regulator